MAHAPDRLVPGWRGDDAADGFENWFAPGRYFAAVSVARSGSGQDVLDYRERMASVIVSVPAPRAGS